MPNSIPVPQALMMIFVIHILKLPWMILV